MLSPEKLKELKRLAVQFRIDTLNATFKAQSGHATTALSAMEIFVTLYFGKIEGKKILNVEPKKPRWDGRDYFILSKGHGCPGLYAVLAHMGFFPKEELNHLRQVNSLLEGHPVWKIPGIEATTGPLGQGISFANGIALAMKLDKKPNRIYVLCGDGELQEGQIWEAAMTAGQYMLDNIIGFVDANKMQQTGMTRGIMSPEPIRDKFEAFGWNTLAVANGHDFEELHEAIRKVWKVKRKPTMIVCETVKGKGVPFCEGKWAYHGKALSQEEMNEAIPILEKELAALVP